MHASAAEASRHRPAVQQPRSALLVFSLALVLVLLGACSGTPGQPKASTDGGAGAQTPASEGASPASDDAAASASGINKEVPAVSDPVAAPVPIDTPTDFGDGVHIRLSSIESLQVQGSGPGERSGPGVLLTVEITNGKDVPISLGAVTVDLVNGAGLSAYPVSSPDHQTLAGQLVPGGVTTGAYLFTIAPEERSNVTVRVKYSADTPTVEFIGDLPNA